MIISASSFPRTQSQAVIEHRKILQNYSSISLHYIRYLLDFRGSLPAQRTCSERLRYWIRRHYRLTNSRHGEGVYTELLNLPSRHHQVLQVLKPLLFGAVD